MFANNFIEGNPINNKIFNKSCANVNFLNDNHFYNSPNSKVSNLSVDPSIPTNPLAIDNNLNLINTNNFSENYIDPQTTTLIKNTSEIINTCLINGESNKKSNLNCNKNMEIYNPINDPTSTNIMSDSKSINLLVNNIFDKTIDTKTYNDSNNEVKIKNVENPVIFNLNDNPSNISVSNTLNKSNSTDDTLSTPPFSFSRENSTDFSSSLINVQFPMNKYRSLIERIRHRIENKVIFCSFEFFPPKTVNGAASLIRICEHLSTANPLFCDITWKTGGDNHSEEPTSTITIASTMLSYCGLDTMMHMTCVGQSKSDVINVLNKAKSLGLKNILALRGDLPMNITTWQPVNDGFNYAVDLVRFIREVYGNYFNICVAGYPTGHPDAPSYRDDLLNLRAKIEAGADFIITQLFFKAQTFIKFVADCREMGINCPILPGILPIQQYQSLTNIAKLSKLDVPSEIWDRIEPFKDNDEAVRKFGIDYGIEVCLELLKSDVVPGLHFYTLNREYAAVEILKALGMWPELPRRSLPWKTTANHSRCMESVRPIFWSSRPQSYVLRTSGWEEFPNGRWGNSASASFRDTNDCYLFYLKSHASKVELQKMWGSELTCEQDIYDIFASYISGSKNKQGFKVTCTPWSEGPLSSETTPLVDQLSLLNKRGILTINSQPAVNGAPSTHKVYGWGKPGGYVYQKAYLEFFTAKSNIDRLMEKLMEKPNINYHIVNKDSSLDLSNCHEDQPSALTWGVFSSMEIVQPTVYDPVAFKYWKDEAFGLWQTQWASLYPPESTSHKIICNIQDKFCLVNLIDNEFVKDSGLFDILESVLGC